MHQGHCVTWATATAMSCLVGTSRAPAAKTAFENARNASSASGASAWRRSAWARVPCGKRRSAICHTSRLELREEHVVLKPHVFLEIGDELVEAGIEGSPGTAGPLRQRQPGGQAANLGNIGRVIVVVTAHHGDGVLDPLSAPSANGGKQDQFLLLHVYLHLSDHPSQDAGEALGHVVVAEVHRLDLLC